MSQNDYVIANQNFPDTRSDINSALQALASLSSGSTAPSTTYANMLWYDTGNNILKLRTEADDAWINVAYINQSTDEFSILDDTKVANTSGTQTGLLGDQATSTWETATGTTESLVSPAKVKALVDANVTIPEVKGLTLLGTLTTTTGTTQTLSGLDLSDYVYLLIFLDGVGHDAIGTIELELEGTAITDGIGLDKTANGNIFQDLVYGHFSSQAYINDSGTITESFVAGNTGVSTTDTSLSFSFVVADFNAGEIKVYGGK